MKNLQVIFCLILGNSNSKMKLNRNVSSSRRKNRARHFSAPSHIRRKLMSSPLSKELRQKYNVRSMPIRKDDEVQVSYAINTVRWSCASIVQRVNYHVTICFVIEGFSRLWSEFNFYFILGRSWSLQRKPSRQSCASVQKEVRRIHRENTARESQRNQRLCRHPPFKALDRQAQDGQGS